MKNLFVAISRMMSALERWDFFIKYIHRYNFQVVLTVSNSSSTSRGILEVSKGCGKKMVLEASYKSKATYNARRQCYVTNVVKNNRVVNNNFADSVNGSVPVLSDTTSDTTSTSTQVRSTYIIKEFACQPKQIDWKT